LNIEVRKYPASFVKKKNGILRRHIHLCAPPCLDVAIWTFIIIIISFPIKYHNGKSRGMQYDKKEATESV